MSWQRYRKIGFPTPGLKPRQRSDFISSFHINFVNLQPISLKPFYRADQHARTYSKISFLTDFCPLPFIVFLRDIHPNGSRRTCYHCRTAGN
jgi:hypothetical protein